MLCYIVSKGTIYFDHFETYSSLFYCTKLSTQNFFLFFPPNSLPYTISYILKEMKLSSKSDFLYNRVNRDNVSLSVSQLFLSRIIPLNGGRIEIESGGNRSIDRFRRPREEGTGRGGETIDSRWNLGIHSSCHGRRSGFRNVRWYTRDQTFLYINVASFQCRPSTVLRCIVLPLHRLLLLPLLPSMYVSCPVSRVTANIRPGN